MNTKLSDGKRDKAAPDRREPGLPININANPSGILQIEEYKHKVAHRYREGRPGNGDPGADEAGTPGDREPEGR